MTKIHLPHDHGEDKNTINQLNLEGDFQIASEVFKQLGDTTRLRIFWLLCHCEECVTNISALMDLSSPAVSHHLKNLRSSGLIVSRRDGKEVYYRASDTPLGALAHQMTEHVMEIACPKEESQKAEHSKAHKENIIEPEYQEYTEIIKKIHRQLVDNLDKRFTIESLAKQHLMNPTTLKAMFKEAYGTSIAAHIKEHRMSAAAKLLEESDISISEIAKKVGYDSQSKFSAAFKEHYGQLPKDYRKNSEQH